jgi:hypothetical protein
MGLETDQPTPGILFPKFWEQGKISVLLLVILSDKCEP